MCVRVPTGRTNVLNLGHDVTHGRALRGVAGGRGRRRERGKRRRRCGRRLSVHFLLATTAGTVCSKGRRGGETPTALYYDTVGRRVPPYCAALLVCYLGHYPS